VPGRVWCVGGCGAEEDTLKDEPEAARTTVSDLSSPAPDRAEHDVRFEDDSTDLEASLRRRTGLEVVKDFFRNYSVEMRRAAEKRRRLRKMNPQPSTFPTHSTTMKGFVLSGTALNACLAGLTRQSKSGRAKRRREGKCWIY
jgi:hypothetical protein